MESPRRGRLLLACGLLVPPLLALASQAGHSAEETIHPVGAMPLKVAVYDAAPYGFIGPSGLFSGASVDLWRRVAEERHWTYRLQLVPSMEDVLKGVETGAFDLAIGAITITPDRLARVDFSYPTHRSGVAVAFARPSGLEAALAAYGTAASQLAALLVIMVFLLVLTGTLVWLFESRATRPQSHGDTSIGTLHEGVYWAVVTMTTVGYGDKTPKTRVGRALAVMWMLGSLALVSLLSTNLVAKLTADRMSGTAEAKASDLVGKRIAAAAGSSGAEYLTSIGVSFEPFPTLGDALDALAHHRVEAVVNSVGALDDAISRRFSSMIEMRSGLLAPASMGIALPPGSTLKHWLDPTLVRITTGPEWTTIEARYMGH